MRAIHMPGVPDGEFSPYTFPTKPCPPDDLQYSDDFPDPTIPVESSSNTYTVQVYATALTKGELGWAELLEPQRFHSFGGPIPGRDLVGSVIGVHPCASGETPKYQVGDQIWGFLHEDGEGAAADQALVREQDITHLPAKPATAPVQWKESLATIPLSGLTAWQALFEHGRLTASKQDPSTRKRILITGAAGSVGIPTVQLAKLYDFHVTALCSKRHRPFLTAELGVDEIIDYTTADFKDVPSYARAKGLPPFDLVVDCVGGLTAQAMLLEPTFVKGGGRIILLAGPVAAYGKSLEQQIKSRCEAASVHQDFFIVKMNSAQLDELGKLITAGLLVPHFDSVFPLHQGKQAMMKVEKKGAVGRGKVVIEVGGT
ncbi:uncharacterized protein HMPREF1541_03958 [Cyphellophora europaea CBS 101466]|uniref:Enoyl reductase (ER) domain-containing protein n=1 Tax=Cyphellophora europaea (strain CBS 101466) TaxID=1220924 RepID=W2S239_CYPE1|nr:uncharacterized protein HMPREF1541_03958 [Cyphellophora europaea CBS 101466]ETN42019.1 hypothetical protein HMPREF1541_03958 [Cyphellophora europaea CBS 101466]